uniref:Uncharacterized protein n=1 Tax=Rhizophora mucronata TaxID=61149 RepID=A0A2P2QHR8_RHIMU
MLQVLIINHVFFVVIFYFISSAICLSLYLVPNSRMVYPFLPKFFCFFTISVPIPPFGYVPHF